MTTYHDGDFDSGDVSAFLPLLAHEPNIIGPVSGREDVPGSDPARYYIRVRSTAPLPLPEGATVTDPQVATALLGVWA